MRTNERRITLQKNRHKHISSIMDYDDIDDAFVPPSSSPDPVGPPGSFSWAMIVLPIVAMVYQMWPNIVNKVSKKSLNSRSTRSR